MIKSATFLYFFSFVLIAVLVLMMFASLDFGKTAGGDNAYYLLTNSDASLLYQVSTDFLEDPGSLQDWNFGTCFYFFPNLLIMLMANVLFSNPSVAIFASSILLFSILVILVNILLKKIIPEISKYSLIISNLSILFFIIYTINSSDFSYLTAHLFLPLHLGAFINTILALIFVFYYMQTKSLKFMIYLSLLSILAIFSDLIYLIYFTFPLFFGFLSFLVFFRSFRKKEHFIILGTLFISGLLGFLILDTVINNKILDIYSYKRMPENISFSFHLLFNNLKEFSLKRPVTILMAGITILSSIFAVYATFRKIIKVRGGSSNDSLYVELYLLFSIFFLVISIASPIINGSYMGVDCIRYIMPPFYLMLFNTGLVFEYIFKNSKRKHSFTAFFSISLILFYSYFIIKNYTKYPAFSPISKVRNYYPELVKATDELSKEYNIKNGLGGYWSARFITVFSKEGVLINIAGQDFNPVAWANNKQSYFFSDKAHRDSVIYNFVVLSFLSDTSKIYDVFSEDEINRVSVRGFDFYVLPDFILKSDFTKFEKL